MNKSLHLAASAVVLALGVSSAGAATISNTTSYTTQTSVGYGQTIGTAGYWFPISGGEGSANTFDLSGQDFVTSFTDHAVTSGWGYASNYAGPLTLNSGPSSSTSLANTGGEYSNAGSGNTFASFTLTGTVPAEFQLTLLMDNGSTNGEDSQFIVTDTGPSGGSGTITATSGNHAALDFYSIDVSGAATGDTITITDGAAPSGYDVLGGVLLDPVSAPEPTVLSLLAVGTLGLLGRPAQNEANGHDMKGAAARLNHLALPSDLGMRKKAFTLLELLVVIGIIAVLIAILMPALQRARAAAKSVGCQSNLHSIMQAVFEYANDCNGYLVPANWYEYATPPPYPIASGASECPPSDAILLGKYTDGPNCTNSAGHISAGSYWRCPEKDWSSNGSNQGDNSTCYSMDQDGAAGPYANETCPVITPLSTNGIGGTPNSPTETGWEYDYKLSSIRSSSRMLAFVCSTSERFEPGGWFFGDPGGLNPGNWYYTPTTSYYSLAIRHPGNTTNVSFMDGHVESLTNTPQTIAGYSGLGLYNAFERGDFVVSPNAQ